MKVLFTDRDGVLIKDPDDYRIDSIEDLERFDDTVEAMKYLADNDFSIVIITNQAGIAEGRLSEEDFWEIQNEFLSRIAESGVNVLTTKLNGEAEGPEQSDWRKPGPNMLLDAAKEFVLDLSEIYMLGDNQSDIDAAINAGCKGGILVETATNKHVVSENAIHTAPTLLEAAKYVVSNSV